MYVFPGIGLGAILSKSVNISQEMASQPVPFLFNHQDVMHTNFPQIYASAAALSTALNHEEISKGSLYPDVSRIRDVSVTVACGVIRAAQKGKVDRELNLRDLSDEMLKKYVRERMYDPYLQREVAQKELKNMVDGWNRATDKSNL
jgi:malate dehydrogenase (oxaloacetate-decarboxylating)(NADP+)